MIRWATQYARSTIGADDINERRLIGAADTGFGTVYGAGIQELDVDGIGRVLSHSGGWGGFVTLFTVAPDRRIAAAATCTSPDVVSELGLDEETDLLALWTGA